MRRLFATCAVASRSQDARGPQPGGLTPAEVPGSAQDVNRPVPMRRLFAVIEIANKSELLFNGIEFGYAILDEFFFRAKRCSMDV